MNRIFYVFLFFVLFCLPANCMLTDSFIDEKLKDVELTKPYSNTEYNYESLIKVPIKLQILKKISTKKNISDGQIVIFKVKEDVVYNDELLIEKNSIVKARVQTHMTRGMNGIPASIYISEFTIPNKENSKIKGVYVKTGLNLATAVFPLKWALTPIPGAGSLTNFIIGGNAKITEKNTITIYYYPNW